MFVHPCLVGCLCPALEAWGRKGGFGFCPGSLLGESCKERPRHMGKTLLRSQWKGM